MDKFNNISQKLQRAKIGKDFLDHFIQKKTEIAELKLC